jgi:glutamine synthetase
MPYSITCLDIWGEDVSGNPLVFEKGDVDGTASRRGAASCR